MLRSPPQLMWDLKIHPIWDLVSSLTLVYLSNQCGISQRFSTRSAENQIYFFPLPLGKTSFKVQLEIQSEFLTLNPTSIHCRCKHFPILIILINHLEPMLHKKLHVSAEEETSPRESSIFLFTRELLRNALVHKGLK